MIRQLITIALITNTLAANAWSHENQIMQQQASAREMQLKRQMQVAQQQGRIGYNYNNPGYYQLQQQAFAENNLRQQLQNQDVQAEEAARSFRVRQEEQMNSGF